MTTLLDPTDRQDLHNSSTNFTVARAGYCGFTHLASGRICLRPYRHAGACQLAMPDDRNGDVDTGSSGETS